MPKALTKQEYISRVKITHEDYYDYGKTQYTTARGKIIVGCPVHGYFEIAAYLHTNGVGCPKCKVEGDRLIAEKVFIKGITSIHGDTLSYGKVKYVNSQTDVTVTCPVHGDVQIRPSRLLAGYGCKHCTRYGKMTAKEAFASKANVKFDNKFDYSKVVYKGVDEKVEVLCPVHGSTWQTPHCHSKSKHGCPQCAVEASRLSHREYLGKVNKMHENKYSYNLDGMETLESFIEITCPHHGVFSMLARTHYENHGCPRCAVDSRTAIASSPERVEERGEEFKIRSIERYGDKFDRSLVDYSGTNGEIELLCEHHGLFVTTPRYHFKSDFGGCPQCASGTSRFEVELLSYVKELGLVPISSDRKIIAPKELDIILPEKNVSIEFNGIYWHSEKFGRDKHYHKNKTNLCKEKGYRLIHIWEDDYLKNPEKELKFLAYALGCSDQEKVFARKTEIREITKDIAKPFMDEHHVQGFASASVYLGLYYKDELVATTGFLVSKNKVELNRYVASKQVIGGLGKVTKYFSKQIKRDIISFCDLARFDGKSYLKSGYEVVEEIAPDYKYVINDKREHKFSWRKESIKNKLPEVYSPELTEREMMELADIPRIWDCGKLKLVFKYKD